MAKHRRHDSPTSQKPPRDVTPLLLVESRDFHISNQWPTTPPLNAKDFKELWRDVRAVNGDTTGGAQQSEGSHDRENFSATSLDALYTSIRENKDKTRSDIRNLDHELPHRIVDNTRDEVQDCIRLGDTETAEKVLQDGLEKLEQGFKEEAHVDPASWEFGKAELLIDQGRKKEAREILSDCLSPSQGEQASPTRRYHTRRTTEADTSFKAMQDLLAEGVEYALDILQRAEDWEKARELGEKLYKIDPTYFDLNAREPMERFHKVRRILHLGLLKEHEARKATENENYKARTDNQYYKARNRALREALEIYNHGCFATELYHEFFDGNEAKVYGFDHSDCANLFFSAARICYYFDKDGLRDKRDHQVMPHDFRCKGPPLTAQDWRHQALHFLEQGRARALLDTIMRGAAVGDIPRRLIAQTVIRDMSDLAAMAVRILKKRGSLGSPGSQSRATSMSNSNFQIPSFRDPAAWSLQSEGHILAGTAESEVPVELDTTAGAQEGRQLLCLQTTDLGGSAVSSFTNSPANALTPVQTEEEIFAEMKVHMRWRKALLYALQKANPTLEATLGAALPSDGKPALIEEMRASIPSDTLVVEYALASTRPCGIMTIVVASDGVKAIEWKDTNTIEIQNRIRELRASMASSDSRMRGSRPALSRTTSTRPMNRPPGPERRASAVQQQELDDILRDLVVAPVIPHLHGKKKLIIVPSGDLAHVPWPIFFLDFPITVVPSLGIWKRLQDQACTPTAHYPKTSIVSNAPGDKEKAKNNMPSFRDIPFSRIEALYIARLHEQTPFLADDQDRASFERYARETQILHICAHSTFDPDKPMSSSLQLFKEPLTMTDWHKLSIKADLVVFSSCLSGISKAYDSGSTIGFAHTLLSTGTKAFVGSLWPVDDAATLLLMIMFYEELRRPLPAADALYNAQERMRNLTDTELHDIIDVLEEVGIDDQVEGFVTDAEHWINELRELDVTELKQERYWAAFVLTGYGSRPIYPHNHQQGQT